MTENPKTKAETKATDKAGKDSADKLGPAEPAAANATSVKPAPTKQSPTKQAPTKQAPIKHAAKSKPWLLSFFLLVITVALCVSGYVHWWQYQQGIEQKAAMQQESQALQDQLAQQRNQLQQAQYQWQQQLSDQSQTSESWRQQQQQFQQNLSQQLDAQNQRLLQLSSVNSQNWELAEALYLTRLANQRLMMEQNRAAALALLEGAEEIIGRQQNPELFSVREAINRDIAALRVIEAVDKEGLFLQLSALHEQIQRLALNESLNFQARKPQDIPAPTPDEKPGFWKTVAGSFQRAFGQLDSYIRKIELQGPAKPLLAPEEQQTIRLGLSLYIESAQIALLRDQPLVYKNALDQARQYLISYYPETSQRQELVLSLQSLQSELAEQNLPDISASYLHLNNYLQNRSTPQGRSQTADDASAGDLPQ